MGENPNGFQEPLDKNRTGNTACYAKKVAKLATFFHLHIKKIDMKISFFGLPERVDEMGNRSELLAFKGGIW